MNSICRIILALAARLVPRSQRNEWRREWTSELWYFEDSTDGPLAITRFCLGSFKDAAWLRRNTCLEMVWLRSATHCTALLMFLATATFFIALAERVLDQPYTTRQFMLAQVFILCAALLILPAVTTFDLGEYPRAPHWSRRWIFLWIKFSLVPPIVFFGTLDLARILTLTHLQPHAMFIGYVLAFRWVLIDQRRRCPACLQLLTNPVRIGEPSHTLLDWYGTELICSKGHGLLHVSAVTTSCSSAQRWLHLDPSWRNLFSKNSS